jgi:hypothetical protein
MTGPDETDLVRRRAERFGAMLRASDAPVPRLGFPGERIARAARHRAAVRWRAAAALAALALAAAGVRPVRAWIVAAARVLWTATVGSRPAAGHRPAGRGAQTARLAFTPVAGPFTVRVARRQAGGTITVETAAGDSATATIAGGAGGQAAELVVLPGGVRIVNDSLADASYLVRVPATVPRIEIEVGSAIPVVLHPSVPGARWVVPLRRAP